MCCLSVQELFKATEELQDKKVDKLEGLTEIVSSEIFAKMKKTSS